MAILFLAWKPRAMGNTCHGRTSMKRLPSTGLYSCGLYSYGLCSYGAYSYGSLVLRRYLPCWETPATPDALHVFGFGDMTRWEQAFTTRRTPGTPCAHSMCGTSPARPAHSRHARAAACLRRVRMRVRRCLFQIDGASDASL